MAVMAGIDEVQLRAEDEDEFGDIADDSLENLKSRVTRKKGRGFGDAGAGFQGQFDSVSPHEGPGPMRSVEGWIVFVSSIQEEAQEDDIHDKFSEYGKIKNMHANLDRRTGFLKGYALVEYETYKEASNAIEKLNGSDILGQRIGVDWAFIKPKQHVASRSRRLLAHFVISQALAGQFLQSWTYWQYKGYGDFTTQSSTAEGLWFANGTVQTSKLKLLSRTYAKAVSGHYVNQTFNSTTGDFTVTFAANTTLSAYPTIIYLNEKLYYPHGYTVIISPSGAANYTAAHNTVEVRLKPDQTKTGDQIMVNIKAE